MSLRTLVLPTRDNDLLTIDGVGYLGVRRQSIPYWIRAFEKIVACVRLGFRYIEGVWQLADQHNGFLLTRLA